MLNPDRTRQLDFVQEVDDLEPGCFWHFLVPLYVQRKVNTSCKALCMGHNVFLMRSQCYHHPIGQHSTTPRPVCNVVKVILHSALIVRADVHAVA